VPLSRRYTPEFPPGEASVIGLDYSFVIPIGVGIETASLDVFTNTANPLPADDDFDLGEVTVRGRVVYCSISGGVEGRDYQLRWTATDTDGNVWPRTAMLLCAQTS